MTYSAFAASPAPLAATCSGDFARAAYEVREIDASNSLVSQFMSLHQHVLKALPGHGAHWVKRRHFTSVRDHLLAGHIGLGVFDDKGHMVGQLLLTFPDLEGGRNLKGYPIGEGRFAAHDCAIIQTLGVSVKHQGKGIRAMLLQKAEEIALREDRPHLIAKTDISNHNSVKGFKKAGYTCGPETSVDGEEYKCVFLYKKAGGHAVMAPVPATLSPNAFRI